MSYLASEIECIFDNAKSELVERLELAIVEEAKKAIDINAIVKAVDVPEIVRKATYDHFRQHVSNEIGNRLRCGIYDGTAIDRAFESMWTEEFDKAIQDRIRSKAYKAVDAVIADRLKSI